jgi:hypothetical protein
MLQRKRQTQCTVDRIGHVGVKIHCKTIVRIVIGRSSDVADAHVQNVPAQKKLSDSSHVLKKTYNNHDDT